jgi:hypothetical protein
MIHVLKTVFICVICSLAAQIYATPPVRAQDKLQFIPHVKPRLMVLTDLSNEPDDEESFVRLLVYADQFDLEGLIATTSNWLRQNPREDIIRRNLAAYAEVHKNLLKHSTAFPSLEHLLAVRGKARAARSGSSRRLTAQMTGPFGWRFGVGRIRWRRRSGMCGLHVHPLKWIDS